MEDLGDRSKMAGEVSLGALRDTASAPGDENVFGEAGIRVLDLDEGELDTSFAKVLNQV